MGKEIEAKKAKAIDARSAYNAGWITRAEAKAEIMPYIDAVNEKSAEIAKKYGMKARKISFAAFVR